MLEDKTANIRSTGASVCAGGDYSCLMHIGGGLSRQDSGVATLHLAEILASTESEPAAVPGPAGQTVKVVVK
jgi:L-lactate dehydrogenase complex protein LldE